MNRLTMKQAIGLSLTGTLLLAGCIERKEHITVRSDGSVRIKVTHTSESWDEMYLGDAWPRVEGGWLAINNSELDDDGKETFTLEAEAMFPLEAQLPSSYEISKDPFPGTSIRFPTELIIEERRDGTYYHFSRTYTARPWAYVDAIRKEIESRFEEDDEEANSPQDLAEELLTPVSLQSERDKQMKFIEALAEYEAVKLEHFSRLALADVVPRAPQDVYLHARQALLEATGGLDFEYLVDLMMQEDSKTKDSALEEEAQKFEQGARDGITQALRESNWLSGSQIREFFHRLDWHREYLNITEELEDDAFDITIEMPGEIVADNATGREGRTVNWSFTGAEFRDRDYRIMVTSRVR